MATGMMIDGQWTNEAYHKDQQGRFLRNPTRFRHQITADGSSGFRAEANRYHLYVSLACPWAHRTLIMRSIKGLKEVISISIVNPLMLNDGWSFEAFPEAIPDSVNGAQYLREIYAKADPKYTGRVTVPVLWDKQTQTIVNNESREIMRMFDQEFMDFAENKLSFYPESLSELIEQTIDSIYHPINNGVYRAGFATSQVAYEEAIGELFTALDHWEKILGKQPYLCGETVTAADWCMFTTLVRFDAVYYVHFKCNLRHLWDYPNLWNYLKSLYHYPGVMETCNLNHIKQHYYRSHPHINPSGIIPTGPEISFN